VFGRSALKAKKAAKKQHPAKKTPTTTQAVLPIDHIEGAFIERSDIRSWSGLILVHGVLFDLLHETEQDQILQRYRGFLHSLHAPIQIVVMTMPLHVEEEIFRFQSVVPRYQGDLLPDLAQDIAELLARTTHNMETMVNIVVVTAATLEQCRQEADAVMRALREVHPDLNPHLPTTDEVLHLLAVGFGFDNPAVPHKTYQSAWQI
jgi:hypothetical protein